MTEREKMISGALYDPSEAALLAARNGRFFIGLITHEGH